MHFLWQFIAIQLLADIFCHAVNGIICSCLLKGRLSGGILQSIAIELSVLVHKLKSPGKQCLPVNVLAQRAAKEICILPQIESPKGIENLEAIAKTPGIGGVFLGPIDLAVEMGHGVNIFHPEVEKAMDYAITRIKELGVPVGTIAVTPEQAKHFADLGVSFLGVGADTAFLTQGADAALKMFKDGMK